MYWFDEKDPDFISFCENTNYAPAVELFTLVSVNIVHLLFLDFMTMLDLGSAYIMFWWCVCFNAAAIMGLVLIVCLPVVCKHELFFFFFSFSFLFLFLFLFFFFFFFFSFSFLFLFFLSSLYSSFFLFFHLQYFTNYKVNSMIAGVFYLLWTLVPLLIGMDLAIRMLPGMTPQLGRLGVANNSVVPGINFALNVGLILFLTISKIFKISRFLDSFLFLLSK